MCIAIRYMEREITDDKVSGMIHKGEWDVLQVMDREKGREERKRIYVCDHNTRGTSCN